MKKFILYPSAFFAILILASFVATNPKIDKDLIGKWVSKEKTDITELNIDKDGYISMVINGDALGGKDYSFQNMTLDMTYECYTKPTIRSIDVTLTAQGSKQIVRRMAGIYEFITPKQIRFRINMKGMDRPGRFNSDDEDDNTVVLDKVN